MKKYQYSLYLQEYSKDSNFFLIFHIINCIIVLIVSYKNLNLIYNHIMLRCTSENHGIFYLFME